jgi:hypothetical protein
VDHSTLIRKANMKLIALRAFPGNEPDHWIMGSRLFEEICNARRIIIGSPRDFTLLGLPVRVTRDDPDSFRLIARRSNAQE